jgi:hypothetical protein
MSRNLEALTSWNPVGLFRPVMGQLYLYLYHCAYNGVTVFIQILDVTPLYCLLNALIIYG